LVSSLSQVFLSLTKRQIVKSLARFPDRGDKFYYKLYQVYASSDYAQADSETIFVSDTNLKELQHAKIILSGKPISKENARK